MAKFSEFLVQGGLGIQAGEDYTEKQASRAHAQRAREHGVKVMESEERRRGAADKLIDKDTAIKQLRQDIESNELNFQQATQGQEQTIRRSDIEHRGRMQPGAQRLETIQQGVATGTAEAAQKLLPGQTAVTAGTQNLQLETLKEQEGGKLFELLSLGDKKGTLDLLNKSQLLHPGRKFTDIQRGAAPVRGNDGQPLMQNGQPVVEEMMRLVSGDGGPDVFVPVKQLQANLEKHGASYQKVGNDYIRVDRTGKVTPVYQAPKFGVNPETGQVFNERTGQPAAAGGISPGPGTPGAPGARPPRRAETHEDQRVTQGKAVIDRHLGISEFSGLDPKNQPKYVKMIERMGAKVRAGQNPEAAATAAINEVNHEEAALAAAGRPGGAAAYSGPTPWRR